MRTHSKMKMTPYASDDEVPAPRPSPAISIVEPGPVDGPMKAAIDWMLCLDPKQAGPKDYLAFNAWLVADPRHADAWRQVSGLMRQGMPKARAGVEKAQLGAAYLQRRTVLRGSLGLLFMGVGGAALVDRFSPLEGFIADQRTATGERRTFKLTDGSQITMAPRSALDIQFDGKRRTLRLQEGSIAVTVTGKDPRPFVVATTEGEIRAQGGRFTVRKEDGRNLVAVQQQSVRLDTHAGHRSQLDEGHSAWLAVNTLLAAEPTLFARAGWITGQLEVRDEPLGRVIEALRPYQRGVLRVSDQAEAIRVSGVFGLDDPTKTLQTLSQMLPIELNQYGPLLTLIERRALMG